MPGSGDAFELKITCPGCSLEMKPGHDLNNRHAFVCPQCRGEVDAQVCFGPLGERTCGGVKPFGGGRCGDRIPANRTVCNNCSYTSALEWVELPQGRKLLAALLHEDEMKEARKVARRRREAEAEARRLKAVEDGNQAGHVVYYCRLGANHIKIGTSNNLPRRMKELRVVNVMNLLAAEPGGFDVEHARHDQFNKWRWNPRTEDFGESPDLLAHIEAVRAEHGEPYALAARLIDDAQAA
jgi:hypothetical protein